MKKCGFTFAEMLIAITIVGVVASMTLPTLIAKINDKVNQNSKSVIEKKLIQGLNMLNSQENGLSHSYSSSEEFVNSLSKYMKLNKICEKDNLKQCFPYDEIFVNEENKGVKVSNLKTAGNLQLTDKGFKDTAGFVTANGIPFIVSYNQNCIEDPDRPMESISSCVAGIYDINGSRKPNKFGYETNEDGTFSSTSDIIGFNGARLSKCQLKVDNLCITQLPFLANEAVSVKECSKTYPYNVFPDSLSGLGISYCYPYSGDYWIGAVKKCGHKTNLPSATQLLNLAQKIYITDEDGNVTVNTNITDVLGIAPPFKMWTRYELWVDRTRWINFGTSNAISNDYGAVRHVKYNDMYVMCVGN